MNLRQKIEIITLIALSFLAFASYHEGTGSVMWVQFLSLLVIFSFLFIFDWAFTNENNFLFDPDADNWRRKVVSSGRGGSAEMGYHLHFYS
jgi:hypothetical protein